MKAGYERDAAVLSFNGLDDPGGRGRPRDRVGHWDQIRPGFHAVDADGVDAGGAGGVVRAVAQAARVLPIGTAYAVWTGIGRVGAAVAMGMVLFKDRQRRVGSDAWC